jgi:hypothetical protein
VARLTTYLDIESRKILRSSFNFTLNLTSAIGDLANCGFLASYVSRHTAMAYDRPGTFFVIQSPTPVHRFMEMKEYAQAEGVSAGFGVDSESVSDLSGGIRVSEMAECWEKVQCTSTRPHVDLVPVGNGTGTRLTSADT